MTEKELMRLRCGATEGFYRCLGKIGEQMYGLNKIGTDLTIRRGIIEQKLKYFGHIVRRTEGIEKTILQGAIEGKRGRGRPPTSWTDDIKRVSREGMEGATRLAEDRVAWRALVKTTAALYSAT